MIGTLEVTNSALIAQRTRMNTIAGNIANAFTTRQPDGSSEPYRRRVVLFSDGRDDGGSGVRVQEIARDMSEFRMQWDPGHPDAIEEGANAGYVQFPNVNMAMEYVDAMEAARSYEMNVAMLNVTRTMLDQAIDLFA